MGGNGASTPAITLETPDTKKLETFLSTEAGKQYTPLYVQGAGFSRQGDTYYQAKQADTGAPGVAGQSHGLKVDVVGRDVTAMMNAYQAWDAGNNQTQANWADYAKLASANSGGQGDQSITSGAAQSQRQVLLGTLSSPTSPTPGLGTMGSNEQLRQKRLGALK